MKITHDNIGLIVGVHGTLNKRQAHLLKIGFPLKRGWKDRLIGRDVDRSIIVKIIKQRENTDENSIQRRLKNYIKDSKEKPNKDNPHRHKHKTKKKKKERWLPYSDKLKRPQWKEKRREILKRDKYRCSKCGSKTCLQVHHTYYSDYKMPWEYPNESLVTLCRNCHKAEHFGDGIDEQLDRVLEYNK